MPSAPNTTLGWVISGPVSCSVAVNLFATSESMLNSETQSDPDIFVSLDRTVRSFRETEEIPRKICPRGTNFVNNIL